MLPVDVTGGDFAGLDILFREGNGGSAIGERGDAGEPPMAFLIQNDDLPLLLSVELNVILGLFHQTIQFRCGDVMVLGKSHKQGLTTSPLGQKQFPRRPVRMHGDGMRAFEIIDGQTEGLFNAVGPLVEMMFNLQGG